jgi:hypothetical protein
MDFKIKIDKKFTKIAKLNHSISAPCLIAPNDSNVISPLTIDFSSSPKRIKKVAKRRNSTEILLPKVSAGSEGIIFDIVNYDCVFLCTALYHYSKSLFLI